MFGRKTLKTGPLNRTIPVERGRICLFLENRHWIRLDMDKINLSYLQVLYQPDVRYFIVFPIWIKNLLFALVTLRHKCGDEVGPKELRADAGFYQPPGHRFCQFGPPQRTQRTERGHFVCLGKNSGCQIPLDCRPFGAGSPITRDIAKVLGLTAGDP